jgi:hypothetical protein
MPTNPRPALSTRLTNTYASEPIWTTLDGPALVAIIQLLSRQDNGFAAGFGQCFEPFGFEALEPKAKAVALQYNIFTRLRWRLGKS